MKLLFSLVTLCLLAAFSQSCTKDVPVWVTDTLVIHHVDTLYNIDTVYIAQPNSIYGLWIGTYDVTDGPGAGTKDWYYSYELHKDGTIQMVGTGGQGQTNYGSGTWSLQNGTDFSAHITTTNLSDAGTAQTITGTYDSTNNKLSGTVTNDKGVYYKATFEMEKVQ